MLGPWEALRCCSFYWSVAGFYPSFYRLIDEDGGWGGGWSHCLGLCPMPATLLAWASCFSSLYLLTHIDYIVRLRMERHRKLKARSTCPVLISSSAIVCLLLLEHLFILGSVMFYVRKLLLLLDCLFQAVIRQLTYENLSNLSVTFRISAHECPQYLWIVLSI